MFYDVPLKSCSSDGRQSCESGKWASILCKHVFNQHIWWFQALLGCPTSYSSVVRLHSLPVVFLYLPHIINCVKINTRLIVRKWKCIVLQTKFSQVKELVVVSYSNNSGTTTETSVARLYSRNLLLLVYIVTWYPRSNKTYCMNAVLEN